MKLLSTNEPQTLSRRTFVAALGCALAGATIFTAIIAESKGRDRPKAPVQKAPVAEQKLKAAEKAPTIASGKKPRARQKSGSSSQKPSVPEQTGVAQKPTSAGKPSVGVEQPSSAKLKVAAGQKLKAVEQTPIGTTLTFELNSAPYPRSAAKYRDPTVIVYVPSYYRLPSNHYADMVVHFHGHGATAARAMFGHQLREQLFESKQNAILVVPQGPVMAVDSSFGQLENPGGLRRLLSEVLAELRRQPVEKALGQTSLGGVRGVGALCASAHSGGYRAVAACVKQGGINVNEVYLFDSLYGNIEEFREWVLARKGMTGRDRHKLISYYVGGETRDNSMALLEQLRAAGVRCYHEERPGQLSRAQLTEGSAIFIATKLNHSSTAYKNNNLRDSLYASSLKRQLKSDWFVDKNKARKIDLRGG